MTARRRREAPEPIAIVGIGCRFPGGADSPERFWELLESGTDAIGEVPAERWNLDAFHGAGGPGKVISRTGGFVRDIDRFDADFFGISPREAAQVDPQQRLMLEVAWEALEDAGLLPERLAGSATGVYVGVSTADYRAMQASQPLAIGPYSDLNSTAFMVANRISHFLDLKGASLALDTACASSLLAVHLACRSLRDGECDVAIVGGVNAILAPPTSISFSQAGMLSPDGRCKPFSAGANGYVRGEGAGAVILKPLARALADGDRIYATLRGSATNHGGHSPRSWMAPSEDAQARLIEAACRDARVAPAELAYVEAHGTGTAVGDAVEARALGRVVGRGRERACVIGSVKSNIGHLEAGAGIAGLIKVALMLERHRIPPTLHALPPNPDIAFGELGLRVATQGIGLGDATTLAGVNSFGIGGSNVHVVLESAPPASAAAAAPRVEFVPLSARTPEALRALADAYASLPVAGDGRTLADIAHTTGVRRRHHAHRAAFVAESREELRVRLAEVRADSPAVPADPARIAFVYAGMGPQWWGMGRELVDTEPAFLASLRRFDALWREETGWSVLAELQADEVRSRIGREVRVSAVASVALQVALTDLWAAWGVRPDLVLGHSVGELPAAHAAGALDLAQVVRLTRERNDCVTLFEGNGRMAAVGLSEREVAEIVAPHAPRVSIAAVNSPASVTISGDAAAVEEIAAALAARGVFARVLAVDTAFHSAQLRAHHDGFLDRFSAIASVAPTVPLVSTVTGQAVRAGELDREHWVRNLEQPVRFQAAVEEAVDAGCRIFLEIGPHPVLRPAIAETLSQRGIDATILASLRRDIPARRSALAALGSLYERGCPIDWAALAAPSARVVSLPSYPWQRKRHWNEPAESRRSRLEGAPHPLLGRRQPLQLASGALVWQSAIEHERLAYLADHRIADTPVFPGSAYLEMASAALDEAASADAGAAPRYALADVRFQAALELVPGSPLFLQTTVSPSERSFAIHSRAGESSHEWTVRATGRYTLARAAGDLRPETRAVVRERCPLRLGADEERARQWAAGYRFGNTFRMVEQVWIGSGEVLAEVRVNAAQRASAGTNPARLVLFDASTLAAGAAVRDERGGDLHLPVHLGEITLARDVPDRFWVHARLRAAHAATHQYDIRAFDDDGTELMSLVAFRTRGVATVAPRRGEAAVDTYVPRWVPSMAGAADGAIRTWMILADHGGLGVDVAAALEARGQRCQILRRGSDLASILRAAGQERLEILHLWGLDATNERLAQALAGFSASGGYGIVDLARAAQGCSAGMTVITRAAQGTADSEGTRGLQACVWGLARVAMREHPAFDWRLIDLPREPLPAEADRIAAELLDGMREDEVALRADGRFVLRIEPLSLRENATPDAGDGTRVEIGTTAGIEHLALRPVLRRAPASGEVEVRVAAAAVNYRDVMKALGVYPTEEHAREDALGDEAAGVVVRAGPDANGLVPGDEVVVSGTPGNLSAFVTVPARRARRRPPGLTAEQAAAIPNVFLTAHYALDRVGRLARGERVLIHAAAGGVGLAAIQVARRAGAEIFCTAGRAEKRAYLRSLGVRHVMDSRTLAFADEVMRDTGGEGVDVVLNSIAGEAVGRSLGLLRSGGRFIELGKTDVYRDAALGLRLLRNNLSFHVVDLGRLWTEHPERVGEWLEEVWQAFERGELQPPPVRVFPVAEAAGAFRHMAQARHIGKLVLAFEPTGAATQQRASVPFRPDATYLVTGGLGGLSEALLPWMVERGARNLLLMGRTGPDARRRAALDRLEAAGARVVFAQGDVAVEDDVRRILAQAGDTLPPLRGVIHAAGTLDDGLLLEMSAERFARVMAPKVLGAHHLDRATAGIPLDFFVLFSSIAALYGSPGQANYAAANAYLDALAEDRRARGLAATSLALGPVAEIGMSERQHVLERLANRGIGSLTPTRVLAILGAILDSGSARVVAAPLDMERFAAFHADDGVRRCFAELAGSAPSPVAANASLAATLRAAGEDEAQGLLVERLAAQVCRIAGLAGEFGAQQPLKSVGFDSLMAVELNNWIWHDLQVKLSPMFLLGGPTVEQLAREILRAMRQAQENAVSL